MCVNCSLFHQSPPFLLAQVVGFIGLGNMGAPMANNLINKGHQLVVFDVVKPALDIAVAAGAIKADSPSQVIRVTSCAQTIRSCLWSPEAQFLALPMHLAKLSSN